MFLSIDFDKKIRAILKNGAGYFAVCGQYEICFIQDVIQALRRAGLPKQDGEVSFRCKRPTGTFTRYGLLHHWNKGKRSCPLPLKNAVAFFHPFLRAPEGWRRVFRRLRTATRGFSPLDPRPLFLRKKRRKKTFIPLCHKEA